MLLSDRRTYFPPQKDQTEGRRLHFYEKGEEIPLGTGGIWQVYQGIAQLSQLGDSGEEILLGWAQPSAFFGEWLTHLASYQAKALSEVYLRWYSLEEIELSPYLSNLVLSQLVCRLRQTEALLAIAGLRRVEERLLELLKLLKQEIGLPIAGGTRLSARLTHQNLASAIGTTRVTVTRLLGEFQRQGSIGWDCDRHLIVWD